jgi:hypothetical protein
VRGEAVIAPARRAGAVAAARGVLLVALGQVFDMTLNPEAV